MVGLDACWVCLIVGFGDGCFSGWVSVVVGFCSGWWWWCLWIFVLGFVGVFGDSQLRCLVSWVLGLGLN